MPEPETDDQRARIWRVIWLIASAGVVATAIHMSQRAPLLALALLVSFAILQLPVALRQAQMRRVLRSGDLRAVLSAYHPTLAQMPHPETFGPLMLAAALAAHGMVDRARRALDRAVRGDAWDAALEHRFFVETLMEAFDGDRDRAVDRAQSLERLPLPPGSAPVRRRIAALRAAMAALARAFARQSRGDDAEVLVAASESSPLVHWAMRYGAAVAYLERGERARVQQLLADAPAWPADSTFRAFQEELWRLAAEPQAAATKA